MCVGTEFYEQQVSVLGRAAVLRGDVGVAGALRRGRAARGAGAIGVAVGHSGGRSERSALVGSGRR